MESKYLKFASIIAVILGTLTWLAYNGVSDTATYYKTVAELQQMGSQAHEKKLKVAGDVVPGSIHRNGKEVEFKLVWDSKEQHVIYAGNDPLPDTFRDRAQAVVDGKLGSDGVFHATRIQAKCASKYEAAPGGKAKAVYREKVS